MYRLMLCVCECLPLCAIVNNKDLCLHGGLSPKCDTIEEFYQIDRFCGLSSEGAMNDLLFSNPDERLGWNMVEILR